MKIQNDYDLIDKIKTAEEGLQLKNILYTHLKSVMVLTGLFSLNDIVNGVKIEWGYYIALGMASTTFGLAAARFLSDVLEERIKSQADLKLAILALQLCKLEISTSLDLLKKAEEYHTDYKIRLNEKYIPVIKQEKYILIPTYDSLGEIKETSLLQEHNLGSKKYFLSIGSPTKVLKLKPAFGKS